MTTQTEALKWMIDNKKLESLKEALQSQEQEPCHCGNPTFNLQHITHTKNECFEKRIDDIFGWVNSYGDMNLGSHKPKFQGDDWVAVYLHPAPTWQELSDDEINDLHHKWIMNSGNKDTQYDFARAILAKAKDKNT